jgi:Asp-tRNA(Asn)/Glu-tRNA(Gln) amidotransferase A subunit family amidase
MAFGMLRQFLEWRDSGGKTPAQLLAICLARIAEQEPQVQAWVQVSPQSATGAGPLNGIPFGAKDIFETRGLVTAYGSPLYAGRIGSSDAALVAQLRGLGAVLLGKTQTTAFAYFDPAPTRNPHDLKHTPGGSSSGSAAAVAAGMVPFALGSQTQGSVLRPASFCGVAGFKPTRGLLPLDGVLPFAPSLDTAGLFTQTADDMQRLWGLIGFQEAAGSRALAVPAEIPAVDPSMQKAFYAALDSLRGNGWAVDTINMPAQFPELLAAVRLVNNYEGARTHEQRWREHGSGIGAKLAQLVEEGLAIPSEKYASALALIATLKQEMSDLFRSHAVLATPAAPGHAPAGLASTGDPRLNSPWTALGVPAISVPMPVGDGLPLGLQLVAAAGADSFLLAVAAAVEASLLQ